MAIGSDTADEVEDVVVWSRLACDGAKCGREKPFVYFADGETRLIYYKYHYTISVHKSQYLDFLFGPPNPDRSFSVFFQANS